MNQILAILIVLSRYGLPQEIIAMIGRFCWPELVSPGDFLAWVTWTETETMLLNIPFEDAFNHHRHRAANILLSMWRWGLTRMLNNHYPVEDKHLGTLSRLADIYPVHINNTRFLNMQFSEASQIEQFREFVKKCPHLESCVLGLESLQWRDYKQYLESFPDMPEFNLSIGYISPADIDELHGICQQHRSVRLLNFSVMSRDLGQLLNSQYGECFVSPQTTLEVKFGFNRHISHCHTLKEMCASSFRLVLHDVHNMQQILVDPEFNVIFDRTTSISLDLELLPPPLLNSLETYCAQNQSIRLVLNLLVLGDSSFEQDRTNAITQTLLGCPHVIGAIDELSVQSWLFPKLVCDIDILCTRNSQMRLTFENIVGGFQHVGAYALIPKRLTSLDIGQWYDEVCLDREEEVQALRRVLEDGPPDLKLHVAVKSTLLQPLVGVEPPEMKITWTFNGLSYDLICRPSVRGFCVESEKVLVDDTLAMGVGQFEFDLQLKKPTRIDDEYREMSLDEYRSTACLHLAWCNPAEQPTDEWVTSFANAVGENMPSLKFVMMQAFPQDIVSKVKNALQTTVRTV